MRRMLAIGAALAAVLPLAGPAAASDHSWKVVADAGVIALTAGAAGMTAYEHDGKGAEELAFSLGATAGETWALKHVFPEIRPNDRNRRSFPSGHTSIAFAAAGYLDERYGWQTGLPAFAAATLVGVARVKSHDHHWYDVAAGAALGEATSLILTHPLNDQVRVTPWASSHGAGLSLAARF